MGIFCLDLDGNVYLIRFCLLHVAKLVAWRNIHSEVIAARLLGRIRGCPNATTLNRTIRMGTLVQF